MNTGDLVGDYRVIGFAGSGGMGAVYKIEHVLTLRVEAMKLLPVGIGSDPEEVHRFEREIQVQARLNHPNIASLYNAVRDGQSIALIMEWVDGESLARKLEHGRLRLQQALNYAAQVLGALAYAHQHGVIHRDVTPANIIITPEGVAKLTDFGLARAVTDLRVTNAGVAVGSPWYMSPEQVRAVEEPDARTDIYSMGAVLYEMLTGRKLFDADGSFALMCAHMEQMPKPPSAFNRSLPPALDEVLARALAKDRRDRYQSAGAFRLALEAAVDDSPAAREAPPYTPEAKAQRAGRKLQWRRPAWVSRLGPAWGAVRRGMRMVAARADAQLDRLPIPRQALALFAASFAVTAILGGVALWTRPLHRERTQAKAPAAVAAPAASPAAPLAVPPAAGAADPAAATAPQPATGDAATGWAAPVVLEMAPKARPAVPSAARRRTPPAAPNTSLKFSGAVEVPPANASQPSPPAEGPLAPPAVPPANPEIPVPAIPRAAAPAPAAVRMPAAIAGSSAPPPPEPAAEEDKSRKSGHWFKRALGKIIGKGEKPAAGEPGKSQTKD